MKKKIIKNVFINLFIYALLGTVGYVQATEKLTVYYDYRPFTEAHQNKTTDNLISATNLLLIDALPHYVEVQFLPTARMFSRLDENNNTAVCSLFKAKTAEREEDYYFSLPITFLPNHRLFLRRGLPTLSPQLLNEKGEIKDLAQLFAPSSDEQLMLWKQVSYGQVLDNAISKIPDKNKLNIQTESAHGSLVKMIERGRADYAIMFPAEIAQFESEFYKLDLLSYGIATMNPISTGHMMCTKNQASKDFLETVDHALGSLYKQPEFVTASTISLSSEASANVVAAINNAAALVSKDSR